MRTKKEISTNSKDIKSITGIYPQGINDDGLVLLPLATWIQFMKPLCLDIELHIAQDSDP